MERTTQVVNVKVAFIRPKYADLKEWSEDNNNIYIGRQGPVFINKKRFPSTASKWCNPYKVNKDNSNREEVLTQYETYIKSKMTKEDFESLRGKTLGCWCKPNSCHGDVLVRIVNELQ